MGVSGLVGRGALAELEALFKEQVAREKLAADEEQRVIDNSRAGRDLALREGMLEEQRRRQQEIDDDRRARLGIAQEEADRKATADTARRNMSELIDNPQQLEAFSMASGVDIPESIQKRQQQRLLTEQLQPIIDDPNTPPSTRRAMQARMAGMSGASSGDFETMDERLERIGKETTAREQAQQPFENDQGGGDGSGMSPSEARKLNQERQMTNEYERRAAPAYSIITQYQTMIDGYNAALRGDMAAATDAVLYTFNKILDPNSVVREGEYLRSLGGQSLLDQARAAVQRINQGGRLTPDQMKPYLDLARKIAERAVTGFADQRTRTARQAQSHGLDPELIVRPMVLPEDPFAAPSPTGPRTPQQPNTQPAAPPTPGVPGYGEYQRRRRGGGQ